MLSRESSNIIILSMLYSLLIVFIFLILNIVARGRDIAASPPPEVNSAACRRQDFKLALDVGHTPDAFGAVSARGVPEYEFNLRLAKKIAQTLRDAGFIKTSLILVRGQGKHQLLERSARANLLKADLLLSIHHDDVQPIYYKKWIYNSKKYNYSDKYSGYSIFLSGKNQFMGKSLQFAKLLGVQLRLQGLNFTTHHEENIPGERRKILDNENGVYSYDNLLVLKTAKAPAVLLEAGVIVNRDEESALMSQERLKQIAEAVLIATIEFCRQPQPVLEPGGNMTPYKGGSYASRLQEMLSSSRSSSRSISRRDSSVISPLRSSSWR